MRLFCFTFIGGTAMFFHPLALCLKSDIDVAGLEYAGHGERHREPFYESFGELAGDLYGQILEASRDGEPYALFGYSMGSIAVAETLQRILERGEIAPPQRVFFAAHAPWVRREYADYAREDMDETVKATTLRFGGVPEKLAQNASFWRMYLPIYRADYTMLGRYDFEKLCLNTNIPATCFYSPQDTLRAELEGWRRYYTGDFELLPFDGNHFFIREHVGEIARIIKERLTRHDV